MDRRSFLAASALASFEGFLPNSAATQVQRGNRQPQGTMPAAGVKCERCILQIRLSKEAAIDRQGCRIEVARRRNRGRALTIFAFPGRRRITRSRRSSQCIMSRMRGLDLAAISLLKWWQAHAPETWRFLLMPMKVPHRWSVDRTSTAAPFISFACWH